MTQDRRCLRALSALLPTGILGLSIGLASAHSMAATSSGERSGTKDPGSVALRLQAIRSSVSVAVKPLSDSAESSDAQPETQLAWWGNGWHRGWGWGGGWHNGGWGNGGWHNGGWGNGGWHNGGWGNGWHNW